MGAAEREMRSGLHCLHLEAPGDVVEDVTKLVNACIAEKVAEERERCRGWVKFFINGNCTSGAAMKAIADGEVYGTGRQQRGDAGKFMRGGEPG